VKADVVLLDDQVFGIAGKADGVDERQLAFAAGPDGSRHMLGDERVGDVTPEVGQSPCDLEEDPGRGRRIELLDVGERRAQALTSAVQRSRVPGGNSEPDGDEGVPQGDYGYRYLLVFAAPDAGRVVQLFRDPRQLVLGLGCVVRIASRVVDHTLPIEKCLLIADRCHRKPPHHGCPA
jgi:hypothetical protein